MNPVSPRISLCFALIAMLSAPDTSLAIDDAARDWLVEIGQAQKTAERTVNGVKQRGVWIARQGHCSRISVVENPGSPGQSISHFKVCGTRATEVAESAPALSGSDFFKFTADNAARSAALSGEYIGKAEGFEIRAVRVGDPDASGCGLIETIVSHELLLAADRLARTCP